MFPGPSIPQGVGVGFIHPGGAHIYDVGSALRKANPNLDQVAIKTLYMRKHGECEAAIRWKSVLPQILDQVKSSSGQTCKPIMCFDQTTKITGRVGTSYLRQTRLQDGDSSIFQGRGGIALYVNGDVIFDSPFIDDLSFKSRIGYDVTLSDQGLPVFSVSVSPVVSISGCSASPFTTCPKAEVQDGVKSKLNSAAGKLNDFMAQCLQVPITHDDNVLIPKGSCIDAAHCAQTPGDLLGIFAQKEATARGADNPTAAAFYTAMTNPHNWACAPVSEQCASLTDSKATTNNVCQLKLRATDLVPMPDEVDLVWYPGGPWTVKPTGAQALYLALKDIEATGPLSKLCSGTPIGTTVRAFVKVSK